MKYLVVLTVALFAIVAAEDEWKPRLGETEEIHRKCSEQAGAPSGQRLKVNVFDPEGDKGLMEYGLCSMKEYGVFSEDNGFDVDRMMAYFTALKADEGKAREITNKCVDNNEEKATPGQYVYRVMVCMKKDGIDNLLKDAQDKIKADQTNEA